MRKFLLLCVSLTFLLSFKSFATHLRAGEITATRISSTSLTYKVTVTTYTDEINGKSANDAQENVTIFFGLRSAGNVSYEVSRKSKIFISSTTVQNVYDTVFTFPAPGVYTLSCGIPNRNEGTINLPQPSDRITFFIQTTIVINSQIGLNSTPVLLNIPVDSAAVGSRFIHNPGAFDLDGDSLAYKLVTPRENRTEGDGIGVFIEGYKDPTTLGDIPILNEQEDGQATFRIDARTGDLIWDAPRKIGQYNVAFIVEEWRKGLDGSYTKIGEIVRDMQIIVVETDNIRPEITVPPDFCVEAGELIKFEVIGTDENTEQTLRITTSGGLYNINAAGDFEQFVADDAATFIPNPPNGSVSPVKGEFVWQTNCGHVREQSYDVLFKVEDFPGRFLTQLTDIKTLKINVNPARPAGLIGEATEEGVSLTWSPYLDCIRDGTIKVYRKEGCSGLNPANCAQGMPDAWNYKIIGEVALGDTAFLDSSAVKGVIYSYRLVSDVTVSDFNTMQSSPSIEFCIGSEIPESVPVITKVSVNKTDPTDGEVTVSWTHPLGFNFDDFPGPYSYTLSRTTGLGGESFEVIAQIPTDLSGNMADTVFTDINLNTVELVYKYKVGFNVRGGTSLGEAPAASTVRLTASPDDAAVRLFWEANVPWNNDNQTHLIYREDKGNPGVFNLIAEQTVGAPNTYNYVDTGADNKPNDGDISLTLQNNEEYCYRVETYGVYDNVDPIFGIGVLPNFSQEICATPADKTPPCPPTLTLVNNGCQGLTQEDFCDINTFTNNLTWTNPVSNQGINCRTDIVGYNVYYSRFEDNNFNLIAFSEPGSSRSFNHRKNSSEGFVGCYTVSAISSLGIESPRSNIVCADNCELISFPNVFSPNGDGKNDTFQPMDCPAFIKEISYKIYDRNGLLIAEGIGDELNWDGRVTDGKIAAAGTYYYEIQVEFVRLAESGNKSTFKGWVEIIR